MPVEKTDLLRQSEYEEGNVIPGITLQNGRTVSSSTSSSSFTTFFGLITGIINPASIPGSPLQVRLLVDLEPGTGETATARVVNGQEGSIPGTEVSDSTTGRTRLDTGWVDYTVTTTDVPQQIFLEGKSEPGSNQSTFRDPTIQFGTQL